MTSALWIAFELLINLLQGFLFMYFPCGVLTLKPGIKIRQPFWLGSLVYFVTVTTFNALTYFEGVAAFAYSLIVFGVAMLFFKDGILKKLVVAVIPTSCMVLGTTLAFQAVSLFFHQPIALLMSQSTFYRLLVIGLANGLFFLLLWIIKRLFNTHNPNLSKAQWAGIAGVFVLSIITIALLFSVLLTGVSRKNELLIWGTIVIIIAINIMVYGLILQLHKKHQLELEHSLLQQQVAHQNNSINEIKAQYETLQKTKHDFHHHLQVIQLLSQKNNPAALQEYIAQYLETGQRQITLVATNNEYVNAVVNGKLAQAAEQNIRVTTGMLSDVSGIGHLDLCSLMGNLFDNAIEAAAQCPHHRNIHFEMTKDQGCVHVFIKNTVPAPILPHNPQLKTRKKDKKNHGYGTKIISEIAAKYNGFADFYEENGYFCCNVMLYPAK